jgi:hypothetical protein
MKYFDQNGIAYSMHHVLAHLNDSCKEAAYTSYWFATEGALPFDVCIQHVDAIAATMPDPSARNVAIDTNLAFLAKWLSEPNRKIDAIKEMQRVTGWSLRDTMAAVESFLDVASVSMKY